MKPYLRSIAVSLGALLLAASALAATVQVTVTGSVDFNFIGLPPLSGFAPGAPASLTFTVDSNNFVDSVNFPTRGYPIDTSSFVLSSGAASIGLQNPFPAGQTPFFALRNNDPAVDGFFVATSYEFFGGVPLDQTHTTGARYQHDFHVTYTGDTLSSLDILDALGTYDNTGLTVFGWGVWRNSPDFVFLGLDFGQMTITPEPTSLALLAPLATLLARRRR
ncbi:MAG: hypothetical protein IPM13_14330 [Phycisphaerales bacterium]|nr:hypothetical protein [Phycisphaerales bacterium]